MPRLIWSDNARRDIDRLQQFIADKNKGAAKRAVRAIRLGLKVLEKQPEVGRTVEDMLPQYRERVVEFGRRAYLALYHFDGHQVVILAIQHGREDGY